MTALKDIHTVELSFSLAWGWWLLIVLVLLGLFFLLRAQIKTQKHRNTLKQIKQELQLLQDSKQANKAIEVSIILRRYVRYQFKVLNLQGVNTDTKQWLDFLDQQQPLGVELRAILEQGMYQKTLECDENVLFEYAYKFIQVTR